MQGLLPFSRGTVVLDLISVGMFAVIPVVFVSVRLVRRDRNYEAHRRIQTALTALLAILVLFFEVELRMINWRDNAALSPYYDSLMQPVLVVHLFFAISTALLWAVTFLTAWKFFPRPASPSSFSKLHRVLGRLTVTDTVLTGVTGWFFYYLAFIA